MRNLNLTYLEKIIHEMNTPIHNIHLLSEVMLYNIKQENKMDHAEHVHHIQDSVQKLMKIVDLLSSVTELKSDKLTIKKEESDLIELINKEIKYYKRRSRTNPDLKVGFTSAVSSCKVKIDQFWFSQLLTNLINNAINHCEKGLIEVNADIISKNDIDYFRINVIDEGCGIPDNELEKIFLPLKRGSHSIERNINGSGIGLAIVKEVVDAHSGSICARNNPEAGANFEVLLPLSKEMTEA